MRALLLVTALALAATTAQAADLTLDMAGAGPAGAVRVMVFKDAASFAARRDAVAALILQPQAGHARAAVPGLAAGTYAVAAFQDINGNEALDEDWLGRPTEPYGFSNNARGTFGPPEFTAAAFTVGGEGETQVRFQLH